MILAVGNVLRLTADVQGPLDEYQRSQLLSGLSITRNLAAEQAASADLLAWLRGALDPALESDGRPCAQRARERLEQAGDGIDAGEALGELLEELPRRGPRRRPASPPGAAGAGRDDRPRGRSAGERDALSA